jgi:gamma-glutamylcyclotransferase (GGCT)/AIG2-like uncharacterized protein YtfP
VYGTLVNNEQMSRVLGRIIEGIETSIKGFRLTYLRANPIYYKIVEDPNSRVFGKVFNVTNEDIKKLDKYETSMYQRDIFFRDGITYLFYRESE